jgi:diaminobutyrate acetyltransferase
MAMPGDATTVTAPNRSNPEALAMRSPTLEDGATMWRIAAESKVLDLNSSYAYLLWCRDFARSSVVATVDGEPVGFVTGFIRPDRPDTLMVWQVAVDSDFRGRGLAKRMLDHLVDRLASESVTWLETTVTPDNQASARLFASFADARDAQLVREPGFAAELFPDGHETEVLFRIGSLA